MKTILTAFAFFLSLAVMSQTGVLTKDAAYKIYSNLVGGKWETKGRWENGGQFHQEVLVETELTKNIFIVKTHDYIDSKQFDNARRNYGVRAWDDKAGKMKFWEFDVFGGMISGEVVINGNNIYHVYDYTNKKGETKALVDAWIYVDQDTYTFKVAEFVNGKPGKEYMTSTYKRI
jgi:hypothetical protein